MSPKVWLVVVVNFLEDISIKGQARIIPRTEIQDSTFLFYKSLMPVIDYDGDTNNMKESRIEEEEIFNL